MAYKTGLKGVCVVMSAERAEKMRERGQELKLVGGQLMRGESAGLDRRGVRGPPEGDAH